MAEEAKKTSPAKKTPSTKTPSKTTGAKKTTSTSSAKTNSNSKIRTGGTSNENSPKKNDSINLKKSKQTTEETPTVETKFESVEKSNTETKSNKDKISFVLIIIFSALLVLGIIMHLYGMHHEISMTVQWSTGDETIKLGSIRDSIKEANQSLQNDNIDMHFGLNDFHTFAKIMDASIENNNSISGVLAPPEMSWNGLRLTNTVIAGNSITLAGLVALGFWVFYIQLKKFFTNQNNEE